MKGQGHRSRAVSRAGFAHMRSRSRSIFLSLPHLCNVR
ncbi:hypothetical protein SS05631_c36790 [Sinorhizobium sp. CCBAU 05631]|nr:hypothetical protein SS05631_c36790 [Sinorhizobium sp. CCBAU 05631]